MAAHDLPPLPPQYMRPGRLHEEYFVDDVLRLAAIPGVELAARPTPVRPDPFPPRLGYGPRDQPTISDVIALDRYGNQIRTWQRGLPVDLRTAEGGFEGSLRNSLGPTSA